MRIVAMLRVRNEARWIREVLESLLPVCERLFVMDDASTDDTAAICEATERTIVLRSPFEGLDESRDKNWLYDQILNHPDYCPTQHGFRWPDWIMCIDGDEVLEPRGSELIAQSIANDPTARAFSLRIAYLWNGRHQVRTDGVYQHFKRPSMFKCFNPAFRFQSTRHGGNLHCSSIPQELIHGFRHCPARLLHLGYMDREDRIRKYQWYNTVDPNDSAEDCYRHIVQGDLPEVPAGARLKWAGPLRLEALP